MSCATVWLSGNGVAGETPSPSIIAPLLAKYTVVRERCSRCPLEPVLGGGVLKELFHSLKLPMFNFPSQNLMFIHLRFSLNKQPPNG
jgi:hypothetical protein